MFDKNETTGRHSAENINRLNKETDEQTGTVSNEKPHTEPENVKKTSGR